MTTNSGQLSSRKTTAGWKILVLWNTGTGKRTPLSVMTNSKPAEVVEFSLAR